MARDSLLLFIIPFVCLSLTGCNEASKMLHTAINPKVHNYKKSSDALDECNFKQVITLVNKNQNNLLKNAELGLAHYFNHNYNLSNSYFTKAIAEFELNENKALFDISTFLRKEYQGEGYDKVLLHNYLAINYLLKAEPEEALVESRNSNLIQKYERKKLNIFKQENNKQNINNHLISRYQRLFNHVDPKHNPYQNPFAYYISALSYAEESDYNNAMISIRQAMKLIEETEIFAHKLSQYQEQSNVKTVELFFDIGQSPIKSQVQIEINIDKDNKRMAYFPSYMLEISDIDHIEIIDSKGGIVTKTFLLADINAIKINEFKEKLPGMLYLITKEAGVSLASETLDEKSKLLAGLFKSANAIYGQNSISTWTLLPEKILVASFVPQEGEQYSMRVVSKSGAVLEEAMIELPSKIKTKNIYKHFTLRSSNVCI